MMTSIFNTHLKVRRFILSIRLVRLSLISYSWSLRCVVLEIAGSWHPLPSVLCWLRLSSVHIVNPRPAGPLDFPPPAGGGGV